MPSIPSFPTLITSTTSATPERTPIADSSITQPQQQRKHTPSAHLNPSPLRLAPRGRGKVASPSRATLAMIEAAKMARAKKGTSHGYFDIYRTTGADFDEFFKGVDKKLKEEVMVALEEEKKSE
jgi:hypothetical protein